MTNVLAIIFFLASILVMAFTLKDIFTNSMSTMSKVLWGIAVLLFSILGCAAYYLFGKTLSFHRDPRNTYRERMEKRLSQRA